MDLPLLRGIGHIGDCTASPSGRCPSRGPGPSPMKTSGVRSQFRERVHIPGVEHHGAAGPARPSGRAAVAATTGRPEGIGLDRGQRDRSPSPRVMVRRGNDGTAPPSDRQPARPGSPADRCPGHPTHRSDRTAADSTTPESPSAVLLPASRSLIMCRRSQRIPVHPSCELVDPRSGPWTTKRRAARSTIRRRRARRSPPGANACRVYSAPAAQRRTILSATTTTFVCSAGSAPAAGSTLLRRRRCDSSESRCLIDDRPICQRGPAGSPPAVASAPGSAHSVTAMAAGTANSSPSCSPARRTRPWHGHTHSSHPHLVGRPQRQRQHAVHPPRRLTWPPNRGHRRSPPSDPDRIVRRSTRP